MSVEMLRPTSVGDQFTASWVLPEGVVCIDDSRCREPGPFLGNRVLSFGNRSPDAVQYAILMAKPDGVPESPADMAVLGFSPSADSPINRDPVGFFQLMDSPFSVWEEDGALKLSRFPAGFRSIAEVLSGITDPEAREVDMAVVAALGYLLRTDREPVARQAQTGALQGSLVNRRSSS